MFLQVGVDFNKMRFENRFKHDNQMIDSRNPLSLNIYSTK